MEQIWVTHHSTTHVFAFLLAVSNVNTYLTFGCFVWSKEEMIGVMDSWFKLGWALINNNYLDTNNNSQRSKSKSREIYDYNLTKAALYAKKFISGRWNKSAKCMYQQYVCRGVRC